MRVEVAPRRASVTAGRPVTVTVTVTNTGTVISGHELRVLGLDPQWVHIDDETLSLFPASSGTAQVTITLPVGVPAGIRSFSIEVRELTEPRELAAVPVELSVPADPHLELSIDPPSATGGREAQVDRNGHGAHARAGEVQLGVLQGVRQQDRDVVALADPQRQ